MASTMRWRYGDTSPVMMPVDAATVIEIGDLLFYDMDDAKPAREHAGPGDRKLESTTVSRHVCGRGDAGLGRRRRGPDPRGHDRCVRVRLRERHAGAGRPDGRR